MHQLSTHCSFHLDSPIVCNRRCHPDSCPPCHRATVVTFRLQFQSQWPLCSDESDSTHPQDRITSNNLRSPFQSQSSLFSHQCDCSHQQHRITLFTVRFPFQFQSPAIAPHALPNSTPQQSTSMTNWTSTD